MTHRTQQQQPQHPARGGSLDTDGQRAWWNECYVGEPSLFGAEASRAGVAAASLFRKAGAGRILELGAGHGRDTLHLTRNELHVTALDYADEALRSLEVAAAAESRAGSITMLRPTYARLSLLQTVRSTGPSPTCFSAWPWMTASSRHS